jgi:hypothetical protein
MLDPLEQLLDHLSTILDGKRQGEIDERYRRALDYEPVDRPPCVVYGSLPGDAAFKPYPMGECFASMEKMLFNELVCAFDTSIALRDRIDDDLPLTIRANFGTVLIASMFGAAAEQIGDNPPWVRHDGTHVTLEQVAGADSTSMSKGWIPRVVETMQFYDETLLGRPELKELIRIVLPDLQGPFDNLELIGGSEVFLSLATEPDLVDRALHALAVAQVNLARHLAPWVTDGPGGYCHQHAVGLKGNILLRNDSCIMVSAQRYGEQIAPHDEFVLDALGGGGIHSCGRIEHLVDEFLALPSLRSLDFGQSEMNDVDEIYRKAAERKVALIRVAVEREELESGRAAERFPTGVVLIERRVSVN